MIGRRKGQPGISLHPGMYLGAGVRETIRQHVSIHQDREVGGVLVGERAGVKVMVSAVIPGFTAAAPGESVSVSAGMWEAVSRELARHPRQQIVGWYHSHRADGPLLSAGDRSIHRRYFGSPEQLALIVELDSDRETWFGSDRGELTRIVGFHASSSSAAASARRRSPELQVWSQRAACALLGVALGSVGWLTLIRTAMPGARHASVAAAAAGRRPVAHPIVVEPQAGGQPGSESTGR